MATTTNYGWTTPDDTALVKDGAAAIRTLGSSIDTTTKNLNPSTTLGDIEYRSSTANVNTRLPLGTAGQVLKVNSGATAPEWATDASGMTNPMTTTGDTIYSSSGSTPARLAIGSTGNVLTVAGGVPTWAAPAAGGSFTLLSTTSLSGTSTTISSISQDYKTLQINIIGLQPNGFTSDVAFGINGDTSAGGVSLSTWRTVTNAASAAGRSDPFLTTGSGNMQQNQNNQYWVITIANYTSTTMKKFGSFSGQYEFPSANVFFVDGTFGNDSASAVSSIKIELDGSVSMSAGSVEIWGIK